MQDHRAPRDFFATGRQKLFQQLAQTQLTQRHQSQPATAEGTAALHTHAGQVHLDPCSAGRLREQAGVCSGLWLRHVFDSQPPLLIQLAKIGGNALPRPPRRTIRLDQGPIGMPLSILAPIAAPQIHTAIVLISKPITRGKVFTARGLLPPANRRKNSAPETKHLLLRALLPHDRDPS